MTTRRLHRGRFNALIGNHAAAPSRRESQDKAARDSNELKKECVHITRFYAQRMERVCRL